MPVGRAAFLDHPERWRLWCAARPATMVDEVIRWATPVTVSQRTALFYAGGHLQRGRLRRPVPLRHHPIRPGPERRLRHAWINGHNVPVRYA